MNTYPKNFDLRNADCSILSADEKRQCRMAGLAQKAREALGANWMLHKSHAPVKGQYNNCGTRIA